MEKNTISGIQAGLSCELNLRWASVPFATDGIDFSPPHKTSLLEGHKTSRAIEYL